MHEEPRPGQRVMAVTADPRALDTSGVRVSSDKPDGRHATHMSSSIVAGGTFDNFKLNERIKPLTKMNSDVGTPTTKKIKTTFNITCPYTFVKKKSIDQPISRRETEIYARNQVYDFGKSFIGMHKLGGLLGRSPNTSQGGNFTVSTESGHKGTVAETGVATRSGREALEANGNSSSQEYQDKDEPKSPSKPYSNSILQGRKNSGTNGELGVGNQHSIFKPRSNDSHLRIQLPESSPQTVKPVPPNGFSSGESGLRKNRDMDGNLSSRDGETVHTGLELSRFHDRLNFATLLLPNEKLIKETTRSVSKQGGGSHVVCCMTWDSGSYYEGEIVNMKFHGEGTFHHCSGYTVKGQFLAGKVHGQAEFHKDKKTYLGEWVENLPHGRGTESLDGLYKYEGSFHEGIKSGKGKMIIFNKGRYEGDFDRNAFNGIGTFVWNDGKKYSGSWLDGKMHGKGTMTWPDGRKYEGRYKLNKKDGMGAFYWADGRVFSGIWKDGKQHGPGKYTNLSGEKGHAQWVDGARHDSEYPPKDIRGSYR